MVPIAEADWMLIAVALAFSVAAAAWASSAFRSAACVDA
jgi:hypothetical protein